MTRFRVAGSGSRGRVARGSRARTLGGPQPFLAAGAMHNRRVRTAAVAPVFRGRARTLSDIVVPDDAVPGEFIIERARVVAWRYLKGAKREPRTAANGRTYDYTEGAIALPDPVDGASRTILTGEGGSTLSRFKHVVEMTDGRLRRLLPVEIERLNGFPDGWTEAFARDGRRAFLMGNALVAPIVERTARAVAEDVASVRVGAAKGRGRAVP